MPMAESAVPRKLNKTNEPHFLECADLILPWLTPLELANVSMTCPSLRKLSHSITLRRSYDASRALENLLIPFQNSVDNHPYAHFLYTPSLLLSSPNPLPRQPWGSSLISASAPSHRAESVSLVDGLGRAVSGCDCDFCAGSECPCLGLVGLDDVGNECGPGCRCGPECGNRSSQKGVAVRVKIVKDRRKGWGLHADQLIRKGEFVFEYAVKESLSRCFEAVKQFPSGRNTVFVSGNPLRGELLTTKEAQKRHQYYDEQALTGRFSSALLVVREHLPSGKACLRLNIDATRIGNVARFVNHSCDGGNLCTKLVRSSGALFPRLCFFASKDIQEDEELTYSYGEIRKRPIGLPCFCNSPACFGTLPSEDT